MLRIITIALILRICAYAGDVKTFDGTRIHKDSVALLDVYAEIGKEHHPRTIFVFAVKIDTLRLYDRTLAGEDYSGAYLSELGNHINNLLIDAELADRVDRVRLDCRPHTVIVQCILRYNQKRTGEFGYSEQVPISFDPEPGHKYDLMASCENDHWTIWIEDAKTKSIVSTTGEVQ